MVIQRVHGVLCGLLLFAGTEPTATSAAVCIHEDPDARAYEAPVGRIHESVAGRAYEAPAAPFTAGPSARRAADSTGRFERINGLVHNTVLALLQDRAGFIWIGTADGLSRYDGHEFVTYRHDPADSTSLSHSTVTALLEAEDGMLWVGTEDGLNRLDRSTGRSTRLDIFPDRFPGGVIALFEAADGAIWTSIPSGVARYEPESGTSRFFRPKQFEGEFHTMSRDAAGALWLGTGAGQDHLFRFEPETGLFQAFPLPWSTTSAVRSVVTRDQAVWVATPEGAARLDPAVDQVEIIPMEVIRGEMWLEDRKGGLWIEGSGAETGKLLRYDLQTREAVSYVLDETGTHKLTRDVRALIEDLAGSIWVGTLGGLFRLDAHGKAFSHLSHLPERVHTLSSSTVMALSVGRDGILWVGTLGGGLNRVDRSDGTIASYRHDADDPAGLCHDDVWAVHEDDDGILWLGTEAGLCRFDPVSEEFARVGDASYVYVLAEDGMGAVWAGGRLLQRLLPETGAVEPYEVARLARNELVANIQAIYPTTSGSLWLGTEFGGLWSFAPATGRIEGYPIATDAPNGLRGKAVRFIHPDEGGTALWLGTDFGLVRFDIREESFHPYLIRHGLPGSSVFGILPDDAGRLWISTNQGLARFDPSAERFTVYTEADGTGNTEYNRRAAFRGADGTVYFGGLNGVTYFHPEQIGTDPAGPPIVLTRIEAARRDTVRVLEAHGLDAVHLSYLDYTFAIEYAALSYSNPAKNHYAYRLTGFDEDWVDAGTRRRAAYTNIPPGAYTFRIKGANADGVWNEEGTALHIYIAPPWWATWWFRLLALSLLLGLLFLAYRYRVAYLLREERLRLRIAGDLHDEIGSKLSSIALASEMVTARATLGARERRQLTEVTRQARRMVDDLRDIVWFVNPRHDQLDNLVARMHHGAADLLNGTGYTFEARAGAFEGVLDMERRRHLYLMYREVLTNIVRHARATHVDIRLARRSGLLELTIRDDGIGFEVDDPSQGEGLYSLQTRATAVGGAVRIESRPGEGTTVHITAKIPETRDAFRSRDA